MAEMNCYHNKFENARNDIARTWKKILKNIINPNISKKQTISEIEADNVTVTRSDIISEKFNEYFTNIGPNLAKKKLKILLAMLLIILYCSYDIILFI